MSIDTDKIAESIIKSSNNKTDAINNGLEALRARKNRALDQIKQNLKFEKGQVWKFPGDQKNYTISEVNIVPGDPKASTVELEDSKNNKVTFSYDDMVAQGVKLFSSNEEKVNLEGYKENSGFYMSPLKTFHEGDTWQKDTNYYRIDKEETDEKGTEHFTVSVFASKEDLDKNTNATTEIYTNKTIENLLGPIANKKEKGERYTTYTAQAKRLPKVAILSTHPPKIETKKTGSEQFKDKITDESWAAAWEKVMALKNGSVVGEALPRANKRKLHTLLNIEEDVTKNVEKNMYTFSDKANKVSARGLTFAFATGKIRLMTESETPAPTVETKITPPEKKAGAVEAKPEITAGMDKVAKLKIGSRVGEALPGVSKRKILTVLEIKEQTNFKGEKFNAYVFSDKPNEVSAINLARAFTSGKILLLADGEPIETKTPEVEKVETSPAFELKKGTTIFDSVKKELFSITDIQEKTNARGIKYNVYFVSNQTKSIPERQFLGQFENGELRIATPEDIREHEGATSIHVVTENETTARTEPQPTEARQAPGEVLAQQINDPANRQEQAKTPEQSLQEARAIYIETYRDMLEERQDQARNKKGFGAWFQRNIWNKLVGEKIAKEDLKATDPVRLAHERAQQTYKDAKVAYGKHLLKQENDKLDRNHASPVEKKLALDSFQNGALFKTLILDEGDTLARAKLEALPTRERGILEKGIAWYGKIQPRWKRILLSIGIGTGVAVVTTLTGGGGLAAFGAAAAGVGARVVGGAAAGEVGIGIKNLFHNQKIIDRDFERDMERMKRLNKYGEGFGNEWLTRNEALYQSVHKRKQKSESLDRYLNAGIRGASSIGFGLWAGHYATEHFANQAPATVDHPTTIDQPTIETPTSISEYALVQKGDGVENVFIRQLEANNGALAAKMGWTGGDLHEFAQHQAHEIASKTGYFQNGHEVRLATGSIGHASYAIEKNPFGAGYLVQEYMDGIPKDNGMHIIGSSAFESNPDSYEYGYNNKSGTGAQALKPLPNNPNLQPLPSRPDALPTSTTDGQATTGGLQKLANRPGVSNDGLQNVTNRPGVNNGGIPNVANRPGATIPTGNIPK
ncbi:hypothetical protein IPF86_01640 [Candidatus Nomurabacteria bacterium]|nr:MAG: hypothetical protein IPF86_01640 [Candidatus Nomurabacteria bacterium]